MTPIDRWVAAYVRAWTTNSAADVAALFTEDAVYRPTPFNPGWRGREAIVRAWLKRQDDPGTWTFEHDVISASRDVSVVRASVVYAAPPTEYANIWLVRLAADGRCREFTEWWMKRPRSHRTSTVAPSAGPSPA